MDFIKNYLPFSSIKLPKMRKLRQWSQDCFANITQFTGRCNKNDNKNSNLKSESTYDERNFPTKGISTISSAIREQKIDPKKDNFGLYALKCDRRNSTANAGRGILLNLSSTNKVRTKVEINSFQSVEQKHEVFQSCEKLMNANGVMYDDATCSVSGSEQNVSIAPPPPPRRKKRPPTVQQINTNSKPIKKLNIKQGSQSFLKSDSIDKNESGLYRIVTSNAEVAKFSIEQPREEEHVVMVVKTKVQNAIATKAKPVQQQVAKVKSYEFNKHQRTSSIGDIPKPHFTKRNMSGDISGCSFKSEHSIDIFQSNKIMDQRKVFDEFDILFDNTKKESCEKMSDRSEDATEASEEVNSIKKLSSSLSSCSDSETDDNIYPQTSKFIVPIKSEITEENFTMKTVSEAENALVSSPPTASPTRNEEISSKPKIVYEQPKQPRNVVKKKIIYYDDKEELRQLIMNQSQSTTIINNHYNSTLFPKAEEQQSDNIQFLSEGKMPIIFTPKNIKDSPDQQFGTNGNVITSGDYQDSNIKQKSKNMTNSNSLRIFSNKENFVFNL